GSVQPRLNICGDSSVAVAKGSRPRAGGSIGANRLRTSSTPMTGTRGVSAGPVPPSQSVPDLGLKVPSARSRPGTQETLINGTRGIKIRKGNDGAANGSNTDPQF